MATIGHSSKPADETAPSSPSRRARTTSRPVRLARLAEEAQSLLLEYEHWLEVLPEALQDTGQADRLSQTIDTLTAVVELLADIDPPRGFGRD